MYQDGKNTVKCNIKERMTGVRLWQCDLCKMWLCEPVTSLAHKKFTHRKRLRGNNTKESKEGLLFKIFYAGSSDGFACSCHLFYLPLGIFCLFFNEREPPLECSCLLWRPRLHSVAPPRAAGRIPSFGWFSAVFVVLLEESYFCFMNHLRFRGDTET